MEKKQSLLSRIFRKRIVIMLFLFVLLLAIFTIASDEGIMVHPRNLANIVNAMTLSGFLTTGVALLMISGKLDFSTGANGTLCGIFLAFILREGVSLVPALLCTMALGVVVGLINALLVNELRIAPFIATLAMSNVATGFVYLIANKRPIDIVQPTLTAYGQDMIFEYIPISALFAFGLMVIVGIILHRTRFGRHIYIVGGNPQAAMLSGVNPKKMSYVLFMVCGLFSALAGITFAARMGSANMLGISGARYQGITAAVLGGIAFGGGMGGMAGAFVGLLVLNTFSNGLTIIGMSPYLVQFMTGLLLVFALTLDYFQKKQSMKVVA